MKPEKTVSFLGNLLTFGDYFFFLVLHIELPDPKRIKAAAIVITTLDHVTAGQTQTRTIMTTAIKAPQGQESIEHVPPFFTIIKTRKTSNKPRMRRNMLRKSLPQPN